MRHKPRAARRRRQNDRRPDRSHAAGPACPVAGPPRSAAGVPSSIMRWWAVSLARHRFAPITLNCSQIHTCVAYSDRRTRASKGHKYGSATVSLIGHHSS